MHYRLADARINSSTNCSKSCKKMVKIGSVVLDLNRGRKRSVPKLYDIRLFGILAFRIFAIFTSNESILGVDDRSGLLFLISQGTLPWQPILGKIC